MASHATDRDLLRAIIAHGNEVGVDGDSPLSDSELTAFADMLSRLDGGQRVLSASQRAWAEEASERVGLSVAHDNSAIPRGREVEPPLVLRSLPKRPPGRRSAT